MFFRNAVIFAYPPGSIGAIEAQAGHSIDPALEDCALRPVGALELASTGFVPPMGISSPDTEPAYTHRVGSCLWLAVGQETKLLPAAVVNAELAKKLREVEEREGRRPGGRARKRIKEDLVHEMLPKAFVQPRRTALYLDDARGICVVDTPSRGTAEGVVSEVRRALGSFPALPLNAEVDPAAVLTGWLSGERMPEGVTLGEDAKLVLNKPASVSLRAQDLDADAVQAWLEAGNRVERLQLTYNDHVRFTLGTDLALRGVRLLDGAVEGLESLDVEDVRAELDARFALLTGELGEVYDMLATALRITPMETIEGAPGQTRATARGAWERMKAMANKDGGGVTVAVGGKVVLDSRDPDKGGDGYDDDPLYDAAVDAVRGDGGRASISFVQRVLKVGYNRAARLVETMEARGVVSAPASNGDRSVVR